MQDTDKGESQEVPVGPGSKLTGHKGESASEAAGAEGQDPPAGKTYLEHRRDCARRGDNRPAADKKPARRKIPRRWRGPVLAESASGKKQATNVRVFRLVDLEVNPENPRDIDAEALGGLEKSIEQFGLVQPLVVNIHGGAKRIVSGHQRYRLLQKNGIRKAACVVVDLPAAKAELLAITLNNPKIQGSFTPDLDRQIESLQASLGADDQSLSELRIEELKGKIETAATAAIETVELKPYRKVHILLSMPVDAFAAVQEMIAGILAQNPEVEFEQAAN
jgi:hypothetical protein